jgi:curved DNA-binding protein CbpA
MNYYETLGLHKGSTPEDITRAWRSARNRLHPDKHPDLKGGAKASMEAAFVRAKEAYECLSDPLRRAEYDCSGMDRGVFDEMTPAASGLISNFVRQAMDTDEPLLRFVRNQLKNLVAQQEAGLVVNQRARNRVGARVAQVKHKGSGSNLIGELLKRRQDELEVERDGLQRGKNAAERGLQMLDEYEEAERIGEVSSGTYTDAFWADGNHFRFDGRTGAWR